MNLNQTYGMPKEEYEKLSEKKLKREIID